MSFKIVKKICKGANKINEDIIGHHNNCVWLLDGATGLSHNIIDSSSDAKWYVEVWNKILNEKLETNETVKDILLNGIKQIKEMLQAKGVEGLEAINRPSASIVIARKIEGVIEIFSLGDCTTLVELKNKEVIVLHDESVSNLDRLVALKIKQLQEENMDINTAMQYIQPQLIHNRMKKNVVNGYWILELNEEAIQHGNYITVTEDEITSIVICSDGFADYFETMNLAKTEYEFLERVKEKEINILYQELRTAQNEDNNCLKHPRLKVMDDASLIYISC